ncbi:helix-turn-helix transcriptional regulator [Enterovibrio norvegicus]|uniref:Helix-turn-helix transcriptional regulator n=1 Tax=Enterovibrio norvegicus TaxID=188144 RepID=A0ABV4L572_9GAMM
MSEKLKLTRETLGLSRAEVSQKCSFSVSTLRRIETGEHRNIALTHVIELCLLYGLPLSELATDPVDNQKDIIRELAAVSAALSDVDIGIVYRMICDLASSRTG